MELSRNQDAFTLKLSTLEAIQLRIALNQAHSMRVTRMQPAAESLRELLEGATR